MENHGDGNSFSKHAKHQVLCVPQNLGSDENWSHRCCFHSPKRQVSLETRVEGGNPPTPQLPAQLMAAELLSSPSLTPPSISAIPLEMLDHFSSSSRCP